jgi:putative endonuclease
MSSGRLVHAAVRILDWITLRTLPAEKNPGHLRTGRRGEEDAYFYLRRRGYIMVARNFRTPNRRGEIKTRTTRDVKPAEAAVDRDKRRELLAVAREYLRHLPASCQWRLEVISVYYDQQSSKPQIELFQNVPHVA